MLTLSFLVVVGGAGLLAFGGVARRWLAPAERLGRELRRDPRVTLMDARQHAFARFDDGVVTLEVRNGGLSSSEERPTWELAGSVDKRVPGARFVVQRGDLASVLAFPDQPPGATLVHDADSAGIALLQRPRVTHAVDALFSHDALVVQLQEQNVVVDVVRGFSGRALSAALTCTAELVRSLQGDPPADPATVLARSHEAAVPVGASSGMPFAVPAHSDDNEDV